MSSELVDIVCTKCNATFQIFSSHIKAEGAMVQCGKCNHSFFFKPQNVSLDPTSSSAALGQRAWTTTEGKIKTTSRKTTIETLSAKLLNQGPRAKNIRRLTSLIAVLVGVVFGMSTQLKGIGWKHWVFAVKYGVSPASSGLQVVKIHSHFFTVDPTSHIMTVEGTIYNHDASDKINPKLMLTLLGPDGQYIGKYPISCCQPSSIPSNNIANFAARLRVESPIQTVSYFVSEDVTLPNETRAANHNS